VYYGRSGSPGAEACIRGQKDKRYEIMSLTKVGGEE
jgi:hypothetical protein